MPERLSNEARRKLRKINIERNPLDPRGSADADFAWKRKIDVYRAGEAKTIEGKKRKPRTNTFAGLVLDLADKTGGIAPYAFYLSNGNPSSLDWGCVGMLANVRPPELTLETDANGLVVGVKPTRALYLRYERAPPRRLDDQNRIASPRELAHESGTTGDHTPDLARWVAARPPRKTRHRRYSDLGDYLREQTAEWLRLTLPDIEHIIGHSLPPEALKSQFWANTLDHHQSRRGQWLGAGYHASLARNAEAVVFKRPEGSARHDKQVFVPEASTADPEELSVRVNAAGATLKAMAEEGEIPPSPPGWHAAPRAELFLSRIIRDPNVIAWVLLAAGGVCEVCRERAPFNRSNGEPFLEVHHLRQLADGGPDRVENAVAACPNCHRRLHFGDDREALRLQVIAQVQRLVDPPGDATFLSVE